MPEIRTIRLKRGQTVGRAVMAARTVSLPEEILHDDLAAWVMEHDAILGEGEEDSRSRRPYFEDAPENLPVSVLTRTAMDVFRQRIPLYFGALFHIGRVWKVSSAALGEISQLEEPEQLARATSAISAQTSSAPQPPSGPEAPAEQAAIRDTIMWACADARHLHQTRIAQAQAWWRIWKKEVASLRELRERLDRTYNEARYARPARPELRSFALAVLETMMLSWTPSALFSALKADGAQFHESLDAEEPSWILNGGMSLIPFLMAIMVEFPHNIERIAYEWVHSLRLQAQNEETRLLGPQTEVALASLRARYGDAGPFVSFDYGSRPASPELHALCQEHRLPNGSPSPWLAQWKARLRTLPYNPQLTKNWQPLLDELTRTADGQIKTEACHTTPDLRETWSDFTQRVFEKEWVDILARQATKPADVSERWSAEDFTLMLQAVVEQLNSFGYSLRAPSLQNIEQLFSRVQKDR
ncbi:hypothetical protein [Archangium sp.]|uniref:hypothetical protein n=1 Tax=Archangium sp. TaxID=1872627 RepID=UPI002D2D0F62|nr:hypothetical protein [Archangium sp.]HYO51709.1 hypothetical protein [Archangium sp.]